MTLSIFTRRSRGGRPGLFMVGLAVDDGGNSVFGKSTHPLPDLHHVAASRVDGETAAALDLVHEGDGGTEGGDDDNIILGQIIVLPVHLPPR